MQSRARIVTIILVSVAVPLLAIWQRWSEIRVFARELTSTLRLDGGTNASGGGGAYVTGARLNHASTGNAPGTAGDWQKAIDQVLTQKSEPSVMGASLLKILPDLPEAGRAEAAQHVANLIPDENYEPVSRLLTNPETAEDIQDLLLVDLLNRSNAIKLPTLLEVARTPEHAKAQQAKDLLQPYLLDDYGDDWAKCQEKIAAWLKEHPDS